VRYALDAGAKIAFLDYETGADVVEDLLTEPGSACYAHIFNLVEVYYIYFRRGGASLAEIAIQSLQGAGVIVQDLHDTAFWKEVGVLKGSYAFALPDAFCLALARRLGATVVTTDHTEFDPLVPLSIAPIKFIR
jgi:PIN domain nuclease of toxin-antitoxin system